MKLCINADDYSYTWGVTEGILYAHLNGIVTSTSVLVNNDNLNEAYEKSKICPNLGFGIHFALTVGKPLTDCKTLCDEEGNFFNQSVLEPKEIDAKELEIEFRAQMERFIKVFKRLPDHIDGHHHIHVLPQVIDVTKKLMAEYGLKARALCDMKFIDSFYGDDVSVEKLLSILDFYKDEEAIELMVHPAFSDIALRNMSSYNDIRIKELNILCDPRVKEYIAKNNIQLIHY